LVFALEDNARENLQKGRSLAKDIGFYTMKRVEETRIGYEN